MCCKVNRWNHYTTHAKFHLSISPIPNFTFVYHRPRFYINLLRLKLRRTENSLWILIINMVLPRFSIPGTEKQNSLSNRSVGHFSIYYSKKAADVAGTGAAFLWNMDIGGSCIRSLGICRYGNTCYCPFIILDGLLQCQICTSIARLCLKPR